MQTLCLRRHLHSFNKLQAHVSHCFKCPVAMIKCMKHEPAFTPIKYIVCSYALIQSVYFDDYSVCLNPVGIVLTFDQCALIESVYFDGISFDIDQCALELCDQQSVRPGTQADLVGERYPLYDNIPDDLPVRVHEHDAVGAATSHIDTVAMDGYTTWVL